MFDNETGEVRGCPARAPAVRSVVEAVKIRARSKGASAARNHAEAMTVEEIQKIMRWSETQCSNERLTSVPIETVEDLKHCLEHGLMRAFMPSAFTLWTRLVCFSIIYTLLNHYSGVSSFSACKLWISKMDVLGQLHITYHTSKSILKTASAGREKRGMMAQERVRLMAFLR